MPPKRHRALTTGQVAMVTGISQQQVIRCFDAGDLKGFKVPMSRYRRVPVKAVAEWAERHGLQLNWDALAEGIR